MEFYTYLWLREDGTPYYVGKGKGSRGFESKSHSHYCPPIERIVIHYWPDEETALAYEMYLVDFYGRKDLGTGILRNLTDGGDKPPNWIGRKRSAESIKKSNEANRGLKRTEESKQKMRSAHLGKKLGSHSEIHKLRISKALEGNTNGKSSWGHKQTEESRKKMSQTKKKNNELRRLDSCQKQEF